MDPDEPELGDSLQENSEEKIFREMLKLDTMDFDEVIDSEI